MTLQVGDTVRVIVPWLNLRVGQIGQVFSFSEQDSKGRGANPLVDIPGRGRFLVPASHLEPHDGPLPAAVPNTPRLSADLPPPAVIPDPGPPVVDWCERPAEPATGLREAMQHPEDAMQHPIPAPVAPAATPKRTCTVDGCTKPHWAKGLCANHYSSEYQRKKRKEQEDWTTVRVEAKEIEAARDKAIHDELERKVWGPQASELERANAKALEPTATESFQLEEVAEGLVKNITEIMTSDPPPLTVHLDAAIASLRQALEVAAPDGSMDRLVALTGLIGHVERCVRELPE